MRSTSRMVQYWPLKIYFFMTVKRTLEKIVKINFFRPLEINQKLATIWGVYIQEKWPSLSKNCELSGILTFSIPTPSLQFCVTLEETVA